MTEYADEKIRRVINQAEEQAQIDNQNIYEGITVTDKYYEFEEMAFFDDTLKIQIPINFIDMPDEFARLKYLSSDRPQIIKTDDTGSINITMNLVPQNIEDQQILEVKEGVKSLLKQLNPSYLFLEEGVETIEEKTVGFFEFKSPTVDDSLFNLMFFVELNHNVMMGGFNSPYSQHVAWRPIARQIMQSIRISPKTVETVADNPDPRRDKQVMDSMSMKKRY
ncbi:hypothetical protein SAMN05660742_12259 [Propionispira arboris]|uniref:Uncharacterized protein n=1 Tax=Propionispira arboris TaxID=84035 RepID=A0A1H7CJ06_9FIRM|nr:hypothetical protein [Propionispira arboris]SEJ89669.1 hypothetical protein SAMN05660742_12259 [Propionispira arboris]